VKAIAWKVPHRLCRRHEADGLGQADRSPAEARSRQTVLARDCQTDTLQCVLLPAMTRLKPSDGVAR